MPDEEVIVAEGDLLPAVVEAAPPTLFRTDDPGEIVYKATVIADTLARVLRDKSLTTQISGREHVRVEGWTLLGTMLGVFPVVVWTRKLDDGWEARAEARTLAGEIVGAAEAECLRTESKWKSRDDYAIRSMAQTRAVSKCLRAPLGFVVSLAGFDPTPEEEMVPPEPKPFDAEKDLLPGAISGQDVEKRLSDALSGIDPTIDWSKLMAFVVNETYAMPTWRDLSGASYKDFWRRVSNAVEWINQRSASGDFPPENVETVKKGFAFAFSGLVIDVPYKQIEEEPDYEASTEPIAEDIEWPGVAPE